MAVYRLADDAAATPDVAATAWVAESAQVVGRVRLGDDASVWDGAVLRGDTETITVGARSNVQEGSVLHADPGFPLVIGGGVTVGHQAMLHGCTIGDHTLVGIQAVVLNGATIGRDCLVAAGALVTEGKAFGDRQLIVGAPAKAVRELGDDEVERLRAAARHYVDNARRHGRQRVRVDR